MLHPVDVRADCAGWSGCVYIWRSGWHERYDARLLVRDKSSFQLHMMPTSARSGVLNASQDVVIVEHRSLCRAACALVAKRFAAARVNCVQAGRFVCWGHVLSGLGLA